MVCVCQLDIWLRPCCCLLRSEAWSGLCLVAAAERAAFIVCVGGKGGDSGDKDKDDGQGACCPYHGDDKALLVHMCWHVFPSRFCSLALTAACHKPPLLPAYFIGKVFKC